MGRRGNTSSRAGRGGVGDGGAVDRSKGEAELLKDAQEAARVKASNLHWMIFVGAAVFICGGADFLFTTPMFDLLLLQNAGQYVLVSLLGTVMLAKAYNDLTLKYSKSALEGREIKRVKGQPYSVAEQHVMLDKTLVESAMKALFAVNAVFVLCFLVSAFYFLPKFADSFASPAVIHALSIVGPASFLALQGHVVL